jgi:hypothetical protein
VGNRTAQDVVVSLCELGEIPRTRQAAQKVVWSRAQTVKYEQERLPGEAGVTHGATAGDFVKALNVFEDFFILRYLDIFVPHWSIERFRIDTQSIIVNRSSLVDRTKFVIDGHARRAVRLEVIGDGGPCDRQ